MKKINKIKPPTAKAVMAVRGFTLFELLVSISIIAILTALASVAFSGAQRKARDSRRMQDMKAVQTAAEQFYSQSTYVYPTSTAPASWVANGSAVLNMFPIDPKNDATYSYLYNVDVGSTSYCACAVMENSNNGNSNDGSCTFAASGGYFCVKSQQ